MNKKFGLPLILIIRDGWGIRKEKKGNAIALAKTPFADSLILNYPTAIVEASGVAVGLPPGYQGNSEVGHLNLGAGRVVLESLVRINNEIDSGEFFYNKELSSLCKNVVRNGKRLHIMGLLQDQGVHAHINHLFALLELAKEYNVRDVIVHVFTDGRDTPPKSALDYIEAAEMKMKSLGIGRFGVIVGRYYAMDRDRRWERTKIAYDAIAYGKAEEFDDVSDAILDAYKNGESDEFIKPRKMKGYDGVRDGDGIIFYNYRLDRARQLTQAFVEPDFNGFDADRKMVEFVAFTRYYPEMRCKAAFPLPDMKNILGEVLSRNGLRQLRIAETEKYAHVTFFFNGQREEPFPLEQRILIHSPKVATYDMKPEMSAYAVKDKVIEAIKNDDFDVCILNFANPDMVGHTGNLDATIRACEVVDECCEEVVKAILSKGGIALVGADHGNAEEMLDERNNVVTSHTTNPVYFHLVSNDEFMKVKLKNGILADIAPTILDILGIEKPKEMDGKSLIVRKT